LSDCLTKPLDIAVLISSAPCGCKMSDYVLLKHVTFTLLKIFFTVALFGSPHKCKCA